MIIEVICPNDGTPYYVDESCFGQEILCLKCACMFEVKDQADGSAPVSQKDQFIKVTTGGTKEKLARHLKGTGVLYAATFILIALFGLLVWPTAYRYDHIEVGKETSYPVRQNRFTGSTEILYPSGWRTASEEATQFKRFARIRGAGLIARRGLCGIQLCWPSLTARHLTLKRSP